MGDAGGCVLRAVCAEGVSPPDPATNTLGKPAVSALRCYKGSTLGFLTSTDNSRNGRKNDMISLLTNRLGVLFGAFVEGWRQKPGHARVWRASWQPVIYNV